MSHSADKPRTHGVTGAVNQLVVHPAAKHMAEIFFHNPTVVAWVHAHPEMAELAGKGMAGAAGFFEISGGTPMMAMLNQALEVFAAEGMDILDQLAKDTDNPDLRQAVERAVAKSVDKAAEMNVSLVLETLHKTTDCIIVATYVVETTPPPFVDRKTGVSKPQPSRARIIPTKLGPALSAGKPLCPICFPSGREELKMHTTKKDDDTARAEPSSRTVGELYLEWSKTDAAKAKAFFCAYNASSDTVHRKFTLLFSKKGSLELLVSIGSHSTEEWDNLLDSMLGPSNKGAESIANLFVEKIGGIFESASERANEEGEEGKRVLADIKKGADAVKEKLDVMLKEEQRLLEQSARSSGFGWFLAGAAVFLTVIAGLAVYAANYHG